MLFAYNKPVKMVIFFLLYCLQINDYNTLIAYKPPSLYTTSFLYHDINTDFHASAQFAQNDDLLAYITEEDSLGTEKPFYTQSENGQNLIIKSGILLLSSAVAAYNLPSHTRDPFLAASIIATIAPTIIKTGLIAGSIGLFAGITYGGYKSLQRHFQAPLINRLKSIEHQVELMQNTHDARYKNTDQIVASLQTQQEEIIAALTEISANHQKLYSHTQDWQKEILSCVQLLLQRPNAEQTEQVLRRLNDSILNTPTSPHPIKIPKSSKHGFFYKLFH